jgi:hypothetical protein
MRRGARTRQDRIPAAGIGEPGTHGGAPRGDHPVQAVAKDGAFADVGPLAQGEQGAERAPSAPLLSLRKPQV